jgi:hypothetical protein
MIPEQLGLVYLARCGIKWSDLRVIQIQGKCFQFAFNLLETGEIFGVVQDNSSI